MNHETINSPTGDPLLNMSYHIDFSEFLSLQEAEKSFCQLMGYLSQNIHPDTKEENFTTEIESVIDLVDRLAERILTFLHSDKQDPAVKPRDDMVKPQLIQALKMDSFISTKILGKKKNFQHLRFMLMATIDDKQEDIHLSAAQSSPLEVFDVLFNTSDEVLAVRDVHLYKTKFVDKHLPESSRIYHALVFLNILKRNDISDLKREFIVEWIFENALINALLNEELIYTFITMLKDGVRNFGNDSAFMHGLLRALQKDYTMLGKSTLQKESIAPDALEKASALIEHIFPILVERAKENLQYVTKQIIDFVLELPVSKEELRLIKWSQWRWLRMLATHTWDASLREPPSWVVSAGSAYCSIIFDCAPPIWLQNYAYLLIERVYAETLVESFMPTLQHYDYVEFLVRSLKKKSPYFASHNDSYLVLHLLSRHTFREASKETTMNIEKLSENNPVSQALGVLLRMTRVSCA